MHFHFLQLKKPPMYDPPYSVDTCGEDREFVWGKERELRAVV